MSERKYVVCMALAVICGMILAEHGKSCSPDMDLDYYERRGSSYFQKKFR